MYEIHLICTQHEEYGNCNSSELLRIIEKIAPEVFFEELSNENFNRAYKQQIQISLESDAIKEYLKHHKVVQFPVDTYIRPNNYDEDLCRMYHKIRSSKTIYEVHTLRNLLENRERLISQNGFNFHNSDLNDKFHEEIDILKEKILKILNNENLLRIARLEKEIIAKREYQILKNIYNYSFDNTYNKALMFIGSGHRQSIFKLIKEFEIQVALKLNWKTY